MGRLIKNIENIKFYHGTNIKNARDIIQQGEIKTRHSQIKKQSIYNNTFNNNAIYLTTNINKAKLYATGNSEYGVIFLVSINNKDNIILDEDSFKLNNNYNIEKLKNMFNSNLDFNIAVEKWKENNYFKNIPNDFGGYYNEEEILHYDKEGNPYFDIGLIMYTAINIVTKMCRDIPKQSIINEKTLAYNNNIKLDDIKQIILITPSGEKFKFNNGKDFINKLNELNLKEK